MQQMTQTHTNTLTLARLNIQTEKKHPRLITVAFFMSFLEIISNFCYIVVQFEGETLFPSSLPSDSFFFLSFPKNVMRTMEEEKKNCARALFT